jgi:alkylation response protein AidB-like acyl-CoA dehydrogenase
MTSSDTLPLSEGQQALQDTLRGFLASQLPPAALRSALETRAGYSPELHARLAGEVGLAGLTIPREFGGRGLSQAEASVVHSELGRVLYPGPFLSTTLAGGMLLATGDRATHERWLPRLADGSVIATVAAADEDGHWVFGPDSVRAERAPGGWRLYGHTSWPPTRPTPSWCRLSPSPVPRCSWRIPGHWVARSPGSLAST